jgi:hypothetical protein
LAGVCRARHHQLRNHSLGLFRQCRDPLFLRLEADGKRRDRSPHMGRVVRFEAQREWRRPSALPSVGPGGPSALNATLRFR